jgi:hypothetical protein
MGGLGGVPGDVVLSSVEFFEIPHWDAEKRPYKVNRVSARPDAENARQKVKTLHLKGDVVARYGASSSIS